MEVIIVLTPILIIFAIIGFISPTPLHKKIVIGKMDLGKKSWNLVPLLLSYLLAVTFSQFLFEDEKLLEENKQMQSKIAELKQTKKELEKKEGVCIAQVNERKIKIEDMKKKVMEIKEKQMMDDNQVVERYTNRSSSSSGSYKSSRSKSKSSITRKKSRRR